MGGEGRRGPRRKRGERSNKEGSIRNWRRYERGTEGQEIEQKYIEVDEEVGIRTGEFQKPGKCEAPGIQQG